MRGDAACSNGTQRPTSATHASSRTTGQEVVTLLAAQPGERILDLGCGDGALTEAIAASGARVAGVDASPAFVAAARVRGLDVEILDAHDLAAVAAFDAVFSNAALHWMPPLASVVANVARALVPGGRFVGELGGFGNTAAIRSATHAVLATEGVTAHEPWTFPTLEAFTEILHGAGFEVRSIHAFARPTPLPTGIEAWLATFAGTMLAAVPATERARIADRIAAALAPALLNDRGVWVADYVRLRFVAVRP